MSNVSDLGTILGVVAHPDDETFICGGLLASAVKNGQQVICITATKGEEGVQDESRWPKAELGNIREKELRDALKILGISKHHWLGYRDGTCDQVPDDEAVNKISQYIKEYKPDTIITFAPDGLTGHPDHQSVCRWSKLAVKNSPKPIQIYFGVCPKSQYEDYMELADKQFSIFFNIDKPKLFDETSSDIYLKLEGDILDKKVKSFKAQISQSARMFEGLGDDWFKKAFSVETFVTPKNF
jgi:LmbE family N-acetylglucosaminyl deacetylase